MAKHRHTPGPWATFNGTDVFPDDGDTRGDHQIADAMPRGSFLEVGEMMANAQLIAAAPDMLEALEAAIECGLIPKSTAKEGGPSARSEQVRVADMVRAALAKGSE